MCTLKNEIRTEGPLNIAPSRVHQISQGPFTNHLIKAQELEREAKAVKCLNKAVSRFLSHEFFDALRNFSKVTLPS